MQSNNMAVADDSEQLPVTNKRSSKVKLANRPLLLLLLQAGLVVVVICYALLGGLIFMKLESHRDINQKEVMILSKANYSELSEKLWNATAELNVFYKSAWLHETEKILKQFQKDVDAAVSENCRDESETNQHWTFTGALLYSITTMTTIGYGHITPRTPWGRIATMIYAIIGIPLMLVFLSFAGGFLGRGFRFLYDRIICGLCRRRRHQSGTSLGKINETPKASGVCPSGGQTGEPGTEMESSEMNPNDGKELPPEEPVRVPVVVVLTILAVCILLGTAVFALWVEEWDFLHAYYFSFVTLATIGFGDLSPGTAPEIQIVYSLYILLGLSLLAMCFDLIQGRVRYMCRQIALKIGCMDFGTRGQ